PLPAVIGDVAATSDWVPETVPAVTATVAVCVRSEERRVGKESLSPAAVELSVPVTTPLALVVPLGCVRVLPVPVAASTTLAPSIGFPTTPRSVRVLVDVPLPAVIGDVAATSDWVPETVPAVTATVAVCV